MSFSRPLAARLARYAELAYAEPPAVAAALGHGRIAYLSRGGTQAYVIRCADMTVVAFRGTQITERFSLRDLLTNAWVRRTAWEPEKASRVMVHRGYARAYRRIGEDLARSLEENDRPLYYCGHSLGGALATLAGTRRPVPAATYSFGSPRVGNAAFVRRLTRLYRIVHEDDIAPKFPFFLGYRHGGEVWHLRHDGRLSRGLPGWRRWLIPVTRRGIVSGIADHAISSYRRRLAMPRSGLLLPSIERKMR